jgi:hypothetical protein
MTIRFVFKPADRRAAKQQDKLAMKNRAKAPRQSAAFLHKYKQCGLTQYESSQNLSSTQNVSSPAHTCSSLSPKSQLFTLCTRKSLASDLQQMGCMSDCLYLLFHCLPLASQKLVEVPARTPLGGPRQGSAALKNVLERTQAGWKRTTSATGNVCQQKDENRDFYLSNLHSFS